MIFPRLRLSSSILDFLVFVLLLSAVSIGHGKPYFSSNSKGGSLLKIDPSGIMKAITKYGKMVLPEAFEHDLRVLETVCKCDLSSLDVVNQELEILNLTVYLPDDRNEGNKNVALRVGRLFIKWNSYLQPCLDIELEDVDAIVEFTNLMLTNTNW